ncbi:MAG TPA: 6-phosphofructokinase [Chthonomonadales bacterium]|nr:6-phosphofructokinase [Chthonomonadales bacterium]
MRRIGVMTSGGDAPGMNAAVRAVVRTAVERGLEVLGIERGFHGLLHGHVRPMGSSSVSGIINRGGTILRTARSAEFRTPEGQGRATRQIAENGIDGLVIIGGDGSYRGGLAVHRACGVRVAGVPGTIDNDIPGTEYTIGFDTAVNTALEAIDKIRDTATSHDRVFVVEVMGRLNGAIALTVSIAGGAEAAIIPEVRHDMLRLCQRIQTWQDRGKLSCIIVVAEGAARGSDIAATITQVTGIETRLAVIGHIQRGGAPSARDREMATRFGAEAVCALLDGEEATMVGLMRGCTVRSPIESVECGSRPLDEGLLALVDVMAT